LAGAVEAEEFVFLLDGMDAEVAFPLAAAEYDEELVATFPVPLFAMVLLNSP
jgi:hypothetical protein